MIFVKRDNNNAIIAVYRDKIESSLEEISENDEEVQAFLVDSLASHSEFLKSDLDLIRVIEDLINILIEKNIITITDFPVEAINKLLKRKKIRKNFNDLSNILDID